LGHRPLAHEIGHLQNARHDPANDPTADPYAYGHGFQAADRSFRTGMAYDCKGRGWPAPDLLVQPGRTYNGMAMGTADKSNNHPFVQHYGGCHGRIPALIPAWCSCGENPGLPGSSFSRSISIWPLPCSPWRDASAREFSLLGAYLEMSYSRQRVTRRPVPANAEAFDGAAATAEGSDERREETTRHRPA
jgi:hypothetical protein